MVELRERSTVRWEKQREATSDFEERQTMESDSFISDLRFWKLSEMWKILIDN